MRKILLLATFIISTFLITQSDANISPVTSLPKYEWQKQATFPDWLGRTDDTLAMNNMMSFTFWHGQGKIYQSFRLYRYSDSAFFPPAHNPRQQSIMREIDGEDRVREIARMLSGSPDMAEALEHAKILLS